MKPQQFFALAGVIEACQENGAGNGKLHELVVRQSYEDRNNETS